MDDIADLKDPIVFRYVIEDELTARTPPGTEPRRNVDNIAKIVGTRFVAQVSLFKPLWLQLS